MKTKSDWSKPHDITKPETAFGARDEHIPEMKEIPEPFSDPNNRTDPWRNLQSHWFFKGLEGYSFTPKEGINPETAFAHLKAIQSSWAIKHEHKEAAVSWLMSLWFESAAVPKEKD